MEWKRKWYYQYLLWSAQCPWMMKPEAFDFIYLKNSSGPLWAQGVLSYWSVTWIFAVGPSSTQSIFRLSDLSPSSAYYLQDWSGLARQGFLHDKISRVLGVYNKPLIACTLHTQIRPTSTYTQYTRHLLFLYTPCFQTCAHDPLFLKEDCGYSNPPTLFYFIFWKLFLKILIKIENHNFLQNGVWDEGIKFKRIVSDICLLQFGAHLTAS